MTERGRYSPVTLHDELLAILGDLGNPWMTTTQLAEEVNTRRVYRRRDGGDVTAFQVHGRTREYPELFERSGSQVRLRAEAK